MKKKKYSKKKEKYVVMDEFRSYKKERHPKYVGMRENDDFLYLSLTHKPPKGKKKDYIKLSRNPDLRDDSPAYISTEVERSARLNFGARKRDLSLPESDKKRVKSIFRKNKKGKN